jgi:hypothetical protein
MRWVSCAILVVASAAPALANLPPPPATNGGALSLPVLGVSVVGVIGILIIVQRRRSRGSKE